MGAQAEASVFILSCLWRQPLPGHSRPSRRCCFPDPTLRPGPGELERGHSESLLQGEALCQVAVGSSVLGPPGPAPLCLGVLSAPQTSTPGPCALLSHGANGVIWVQHRKRGHFITSQCVVTFHPGYHL